MANVLSRTGFHVRKAACDEGPLESCNYRLILLIRGKTEGGPK